MEDKELVISVTEIKRIREVETVLNSISSKITAIPKSGVGTVIDVGCGCGASLKALRGHFPAVNLFGVDNQPDSIKEARGLNMPKVNIVCGEALAYLRDRKRWPDESVDLISVFEASPPLLPLNDVISESARVLKKGGQMVVTTWVGVDAPSSLSLKVLNRVEGSKFEEKVYLLTKRDS